MADDPQVKKSGSGRRALANYVGLGRTATQSHFRMAIDNLPPGAPYPALEKFEDARGWEWIRSWLGATYRMDIESIFVPAEKKHTFDPYPSVGEQGHYDLSNMLAPDNSIRIALAGDWGTGTDEAQRIADNMVASNPELTIHLGDVYFVGLDTEVKENCLGHDSSNYKGVFWRNGSRGSFALNGNHEMYSGGNGYFDTFLPTLGIPTSQDKQQLRSYFCLETPRWRILAIDTGYNSDTFFGKCELDDNLLEWLRTVIDPVRNRKPTVLLSHHQWFSDFGDGEYEAPANQMAAFLQDQEIVWLWAHEHRLALYNKYKGQNGITAYARCIGHGGMPVDRGKPIADIHQLEYYDASDQRTKRLNDGTEVGLNGYVQMLIQDATLTLEYFDIHQTSLLKESFQLGGARNWDGTLVRTVIEDPAILQHVTYEQSRPK